MIKKYADENTEILIFVITVIVLALFTAGMFLFAAIFNVDLTDAVHDVNFYLTSISGKIVLAVLIIFVLIQFKMQSLMKPSSKELLKSFAIGWFCFVIPLAIFVTGFDYSRAGSIERGNWILLLLYAGEMLLAGITEEFLCRGFIYNAIFNKHNDVKKAVFISAAIFGAAHIINLVHQTPVNTIFQIIFAFVGGVFFAAIYARCKNIWALALMHAFWNIGFGAAEILTPSETVVESGILEQVPMLIVLVFMLCMGMFLIRKKKLSPLLPQ